MPNFAQAIKAEIMRLSRKEVKAAVNPVRKSNFLLKKVVAELKRNVAALEAAQKRLLTSAEKEKPRVSPEEAKKIRATSRGIRILRRKLKLSQDSFAKLLGVSSQAVYAMEHKEGRLRLRPATLANLLAARGMGKREAKRRLEEIGGKKQPAAIAKRQSKR